MSAIKKIAILLILLLVTAFQTRSVSAVKGLTYALSHLHQATEKPKAIIVVDHSSARSEEEQDTSDDSLQVFAEATQPIQFTRFSAVITPKVVVSAIPQPKAATNRPYYLLHALRIPSC